jgi:hypothetical protein
MNRSILALIAAVLCVVAGFTPRAEAVQHAGLGRWVQRDPPQFEYGEGMSLYWYGSNSPLETTDPLGGTVCVVAHDAGGCSQPQMPTTPTLPPLNPGLTPAPPWWPNVIPRPPTWLFPGCGLTSADFADGSLLAAYRAACLACGACPSITCVPGDPSKDPDGHTTPPWWWDPVPGITVFLPPSMPVRTVLIHELRHAWQYCVGRPDGCDPDASECGDVLCAELDAYRYSGTCSTKEDCCSQACDSTVLVNQGIYGMGGPCFGGDTNKCYNTCVTRSVETTFCRDGYECINDSNGPILY